ncbi:BRCA1-associated RING domain protein 1 [Discoglossus pictus]
MLLRVRSGNQPRESGGIELTMKEPTAWSRTRAALRDLEGRLRCAECAALLKDPVCLGGCEHVFCKTCVGESVGSECPRCHTPAWVRDIQINRQLDNMIQLCSKLKVLLDKGQSGENKMDLCQDSSLKPNTTQEGEGKKKQIKMWYSPRSRKMRCVVEKGTKSQPIPSNVSLSSYDFVASSPDIEPVKKKTAPTRKSKQKKLADINQEWGFGNRKDNYLQENGKEPINSRTVSFCSPPTVSQSHDGSQESASKDSQPAKDVQGKSECELDEPIKDQSDNMASLNVQHTRIEDVPCETLLKVNKRTPAKRKGRQLEPLISPVSKRSRRRKSQVSDSNGTEESLEVNSPVQGYKKILTPHDHSVNANECDKKTIEAKFLHSPTALIKEETKAGHSSLLIQTSPSNFSNSKRNHKGETMLHLASIKGDLQSVEELLKSGANPNVKDNAGWTPLHEACNHGHKDVVELLLQHQALVNTAGYQNDTPLHDAARNGHSAIVQLLLCHGASRDAVNIFGMRPVDYAETEEIKSALLQTQTTKEPQLLRSCPVLSPNQQRKEAVVLIASGLSASQRNDLNKLATVLKAERYTEYNTAVTHVIVGDEPVLRTMKCMLGTLAGCWIVGFAWVEACLKSCGREPEEQYEIPNGPCRARLNREQLLPTLLDGCHFYFLGFFKEHRKEDLAELVKAAGGQILTRQPKPESDVTQTINTVAYHADADSDQRFCTQYIIYDKASKYQPGKVRQGKVWVAPSSWLIECIISFQLLPVHQ